MGEVLWERGINREIERERGDRGWQRTKMTTKRVRKRKRERCVE